MRAASILALILTAVVAATARAETPQRPNILFIYSDDHSYRSVSCYPGADEWVKTPAIDKLASEGMRFDSAYIGTWCMPSRATLLTGHHQFGIESMRMEGDYPGSEYDPAKCPFWPRTFREQGYTTAQIGKWHTGTDTGYGRDWDFQWVWNRPKFTDTAGHYYYDQPVTIHGGETQMIARYSTDQYTDWACDFIAGQDRDPDKPWYLWLCYGAVHGPYTPAERHLDDYPDAQVTPPVDIYPPRPGKPDWAQRIDNWKPGDDGQPVQKKKTLTEWVRQYNQGVVAIDEGVARILDTLKKSGQHDNTLVVFTSDQGFAWGQHGFTHKLAAYDANIRSPLIFRLPGRIPAGTVCTAAVSGVDLVPTFFRFAGIDPPWDMHGRDLSPLLANPKRDWSHPAMLTNTGRSFGSDTHVIPDGEDAYQNQVPWYVMLRVSHFKYVRPLIPDDLEELYDLRADPDELDNLAVKPEHRELLHTLRQAAIDELRRTNAGFIDAMPPPREG